MTQKGLTLPNVAFRPYSPAEMAALDDLRPDVLVWLLYGGEIDATHSHQLAPYIRAHAPRILYRPYAGNIPQWSPAAWSRECYRRIITLGWHGELICANEMNLASEGGSEDWGKQIAWLKDFAAAWKADGLGDPLHLPALSPTGNYQYGLRTYLHDGLPDFFDVVDFHCYTVEDLNEASITGLLHLDKPAMITEFNGISPDILARQREVDFAGAVYFILGGTPDQAQYDILKQPSYYQSFKAWRPTPMADFDSPNHEGPRAATVGVVLHATLGGTVSPQTEYDATLTWFANPASQVSAHAVVGPAGQVHRPVRTDEIAWHAKAANKDHLGIEMAKAKLGDVIGEDILETTARIVAGWCHDYEIPIVWSASHGIEEHRNIPGNDHQDVGGPFDRADFLARVKHYAGEDTLTDAQKKAVLDDLDILWGMTKADTIKVNPAESERACHERIVALKVALGLNQG